MPCGCCSAGLAAGPSLPLARSRPALHSEGPVGCTAIPTDCAQEVLKPLQLSLDTKSDRLKSRALAICQNLIANAALPAEASEAVTAMLARVDKNTDENVQLKTLQTALTLLQSPLRPRSEEQIGAVLGVCLRLTNRKGHKDAVLTTAAATVRQAVALVLSYVDVEAELQGQAAAAEAGESGEAPGGAAFAAQKLVEDLCNIASGGLPRVKPVVLLAFGLHLRPAGDWRAFFAHAVQPAVCHDHAQCPSSPCHASGPTSTCRRAAAVAQVTLPATHVCAGAARLCAGQLARRLPPPATLPERTGRAHDAAHPGAAAGAWHPWWLFSCGLGVLAICYAFVICSRQAFFAAF